MPIKKYTQEQCDYIKSIAPRRNLPEILQLILNRYPELDMSLSKLRSFMSNHKIKRGCPKRKSKYTEEQLNFIKENVVNTEKELVKMFNEKFLKNITVGILGNIKSKLGVKSGLIGGRFEKGQKSFNKGKKWSEFMTLEGQINSMNTCFKKGDIPKNHRPVGSERINTSGYIEIKVQEPNKWRLKHRFVYEKYFGKIPKDKNVIFLDNNRLNVDIENLALVSRSENAILNKQKLRSDNRHITESGLALAKVLDKINIVNKKGEKNGKVKHAMLEM